MVSGPELDEQVLRRLFSVAGPEQSVEILDRLVLDLTAVRAVLARGAEGDVAELRRNIHILIGIAGTVGALHLHQLAMAAGKHLREAETPDPAAAVAPLSPLTDRLIARLKEMRAEH